MNGKALQNKGIRMLLSLLMVGTILGNSQIGISKAADVIEVPDVVEVPDVIKVQETLTLDKAMELAVANNLDLKIAEAEMNRTSISSSQQSKIAKDDADTGSYDADLMIEIAKVNRKLLPKLAEETYKTEKIQIELAVKSAYSQLVYSKEAYELAKKYKSQVDESYKFIQKKFGLGQASNIEVLNAEAEVSSKDAELIQADITFKQKLMDMNQLMNQPLEKAWTLDKAVDATVIVLPDLETMKTNMNANHPLLLSSNLSFTLAETTFTLAKGFYPDNVWTYKYAEQDFNKAKSQYELTQLTQEKNLRQAYIAVGGSIEAVKMLQKSVDTISESYRISKVRYELGMITGHDLNEALLALQGVENTLLNAKLNYQLAIAQLEFISAYKIER